MHLFRTEEFGAERTLLYLACRVAPADRGGGGTRHSRKLSTLVARDAIHECCRGLSLNRGCSVPVAVAGTERANERINSVLMPVARSTLVIDSISSEFNRFHGRCLQSSTSAHENSVTDLPSRTITIFISIAIQL